MFSILELQVITGADTERALAYVLQTDDFRFLLDCGWDESFSLEIIEEYQRHITSIDAVLITCPDLYHLGALPYLVGQCELKCPIYVTTPVYIIGKMFIYDLYQSRSNTEDFNLFKTNDIDAAFDLFVQLKYDQSVPVKGIERGLTITPLPSGHMNGGAIWKISEKNEEEKIVYVVDEKDPVNLTKISRPTLRITDALNAKYLQEQREAKDALLLTNILETMRRDGNVLICIDDTVGCVLELALLLEQWWHDKKSGLSAYSLALLNNDSSQVIEFARSQVESMSDKIVPQFHESRANPLHLHFVKLCQNLTELERVPAPKVVLASQPDLESGFARDLFVQWVENDKNSIILTTRTRLGTLARELIDKPNLKTIAVEVHPQVRPEGAEFKKCMERQRSLNEQKVGEAQARKKKIRKKSKCFEDEPMDSAVDGDTEEEDDDKENEANEISPSTKDTVLVENLFSSPTSNSSNPRVPPQSSCVLKRKTFPIPAHKEDKYVCDNYREEINHEDSMIVETQPSLPHEVSSSINFGDSDERHPLSKLLDTTNNQHHDPSQTMPKQSLCRPSREYGPGFFPSQQTPHKTSGVPYKMLRNKCRLELNAKVLYVDLAPRCDRESIENLCQTPPKNFIRIHDTQYSIEQLKIDCSQSNIRKKL